MSKTPESPAKVTPLEAAVECVEGTLRAVSDGARAFQEQVELKRLLEPEGRSKLLGALVDGYATYFEGMAQVAGDLALRLRSTGKATKSDEG